jgi:predicted ATPase
MTENMLLDRITLKNLLSFRHSTIELGPLNVLIGENTAGKSNLIEAIGLLQSLPSDFRTAILRGGGAHFWIWLGAASPVAEIGFRTDGVEYNLEFSEAFGLQILNEKLFREAETYFDRVRLSGFAPNPFESMFSANRNLNDPTPATRIGRQLDRIRIYREFQTGPRSGSRNGISTSQSGDHLSEAGDNLATVLQELDFRNLRERIAGYLNRLSNRIGDVRVRLDGAIAKAYVREKGLLEMLPSSRMSDGTLKFLCLVAVLLHPDPPPMICIDEPEQGLHPDAVQIVAELLRDASERTQIVVTTHSEALIDEFSDMPEAVLVCERDEENGTQCRRLSSERLQVWLEEYSLGKLWRKGELGGNRW